ncbi:hypothetical protein PLESTB_001574600 [Pleodorina starrii]|uniref:Uncharacterized protein n=1 Tax=Pleodorina starrii TaxID=330485 RepID=A0A9W6F900_9CHLO|nr:hypothetical protein PLESTM_000880000 [Pleodorina starrii]GLC60106.1 hypothetical protein PLESTB_001574600 [Pleodorina starrii]GLC68994.1 hypothetical protein PLESTF_000767400 [Pleodorina starrii]
MFLREARQRSHAQSDKKSPPGANSASRPHRPGRCRTQLQHLAPRAQGQTGDSSGNEGASSSGLPRQQRQQQQSEVGVGLKAVWYGAEQFGKLISLGKENSTQQPSSSSSSSSSRRRLSREEMLAAIRADYDEQYFVRGLADMEAYAPDCVFADPFVSFSGTQRFKQNVSNLGGLMSDIRLEVYDWVEGPSSLETRWRFSALLDLPWRPRLAAAGGTTHVMDLERGRVVRHEERWEVEPGKVVAQLLRPAAQVPTNPWETFLLSASAGDVTGMWFVLSPLVLRASAAATAASLVWGLLPASVSGGQGGLLPGPVLAGCELLFCGCVVTEVLKFAQGMQGGETGTGGRF